MILQFGRFLALIWVLSALFSNNVQAAQSKTDVRILVDVSGSMKRNDPNNLRVPAVRLISGILPKGAKAGVWMFAEGVEPLSDVGTVTKSSKKRINTLAKRIHNRGMFTNIGSALEVATADWSDNKSSDQRIVILLTDGVVDISKNSEVNRKERLRIQESLMPELKQLNARIYTIALSSEADKELLAQLSNSTDAWFEAVTNADQLEKVFLKIFEQSVNVPSLPITNNKFKVDPSIEEFTALIFRSSIEPITLISPSGKQYEADTMESKVSWFEENKFDLVTIQKPEPGQWKIDGPVDPDNRILVVSDLALDVNNDELPTNMLNGESLNLKVSLKEKGEIINRANFLSLINFNGEVVSNSGAIDDELVLEDNGKNGDLKEADGVFGYQFVAPKIDDEVTFEVRITSPTFERVYQRSVRVFSKYVNFQTKVAESIDTPHLIEIIPLLTVVNTESLVATGILKMPDGSEIELSFTKGDKGKLFAEVAADNVGGNYKALIDIEGEILSGKKFKITQEQVSFEAASFQNEDAVEEVIEEKTEVAEAIPEEVIVAEEDSSSEESAADTETIEGEDFEAGLSSMWWMIIGVAFNVLLFGGGFIGWKIWKKKQSAAADDLASALDDEDNSKETKPKKDGK